MKTDDQKKSTTIKTPWWGFVVSIALIAIRAFAPNSSPIESWSVWSWVLMLTPILFPLYIYIICWSVSIIGMGICQIIIKIMDFMDNYIRNRK